MGSSTYLYSIIIFIIVLVVVLFLFASLFQSLNEPLNNVYKVSAEPACIVSEFGEPVIITCGQSYCGVVDGRPACALCDCEPAHVIPAWITQPSCWFWQLGRPECS